MNKDTKMKCTYPFCDCLQGEDKCDDSPDYNAIPPQQKQEDGDLWDEVQSRFNAWLFEDGEASLDDIFNELKSNYSLKRK